MSALVAEIKCVWPNLLTRPPESPLFKYLSHNYSLPSFHGPMCTNSELKELKSAALPFPPASNTPTTPLRATPGHTYRLAPRGGQVSRDITSFSTTEQMQRDKICDWHKPSRSPATEKKRKPHCSAVLQPPLVKNSNLTREGRAKANVKPRGCDERNDDVCPKGIPNADVFSLRYSLSYPRRRAFRHLTRRRWKDVKRDY